LKICSISFSNNDNNKAFLVPRKLGYPNKLFYSQFLCNDSCLSIMEKLSTDVSMINGLWRASSF
jgi:hypothetical protein